jgi:hypothetical protein
LLERLRISPWVAVALAALVAAFCGNALAGSQATQSAKPLTAKKAKRLFNRLLRRRAPGLSVAAAGTAATATDATTVGGLQVKEISYTAAGGSAAVEVFRGSGLSVNAACPADVSIGPNLSASALGEQEAALKFAGAGFFPGNPVRVDLFQFNVNDPAANLDSGEDRGAAQLSYIREDGATVNGTISWEDGLRTAQDLCAVSGVLIAG